MLSEEAADLLLDTFEACRNVKDLYLQKEEAEALGTDEDIAEVTKMYDEAVIKAGEVYMAAVVEVPPGLLAEVANQGLPEHMIIE